MNIAISHRLPNRIRLMYNKSEYSIKQMILAQELLSFQEGVVSVDINHRTGSILMYYEGVSEKQILSYVVAMDDEYLNDQELLDHISEEREDISLFKSISTLIIAHFSRRLLPFPIRTALLLFNSIPRIFKGLKTVLGSSEMNAETLDAAAISMALYTRDYNSAGNIGLLLNISDTLERHTRKKSYENLSAALMAHTDSVQLVIDNEEITVPSDSVKIGDIAILRAGYTIPVDGVVISGNASVNQSAMTGEFLSVHIYEGINVYAGSFVDDGEVLVKVVAKGNDTQTGKISKMIENSQLLKSQIEKRSERVAGKLVKYSFMLAFLTYFFTRDIRKVSATLMVDYSCAMKLVAPVAVLSAIREAATRGIIIKGGKFLENAAHTETIIFDKTGTLTLASPKVKDIIGFNDYTPEEVLKTAACLEEHFPHPLAEAVVVRCQEDGIEHVEEHAKVELVVAHGLKSSINGDRLLIGSAHFVLDDNKIEISVNEISKINEFIDLGYSILYLAKNLSLMGIIAIEDTVRPEARQVIERLKADGIERVAILTGDNRRSAENIATKVGADICKSEVLPSEKVVYLESMRKFGKILMVGDGINDAPALSSADTGIAMYNSSGMATDSADIILSDEGLNDLIHTRRLGSRLLKRISTANKMIIGVNSFLIFAGLTAILTPAKAAVLHNLSTVGISAWSSRKLLDKGE